VTAPTAITRQAAEKIEIAGIVGGSSNRFPNASAGYAFHGAIGSQGPAPALACAFVSRTSLWTKRRARLSFTASTCDSWFNDGSGELTEGVPIESLPGRRTRRRIICGCMFHREIDVLDWRLHELSAVVDRFIVVEATQTHSGRPRELVRPDRDPRFAHFAGRLHGIVIDDLPDGPDPMPREMLQRQAIWTRGGANLGLADDDLVLISDADEVPFPEVVDRLAMAAFDWPVFVRPHWFNFNWDTYLGPWIDYSIRFYPAGFLRRIFAEGRETRAENFARGIRLAGLNGWHASWFGSDDVVLDKLASYCHAPEEKDLRAAAEGAVGVRRRRTAGFDMFGTRPRLDALPRLPLHGYRVAGG
jgi:hypothetical protein